MRNNPARDAVEAYLRFPLSDEEWGLLERLHYASDVEQSLSDSRELEAVVKLAGDAIRDMRGVYGVGFVPPTPGQSRDLTIRLARKLPPRQQAISILMAEAAARDQDVVRFRETVLEGKLLGWSEVEDWIERTGGKEVGTSGLLTVPIPTGTNVNVAETGLRVSPPLTIEHVRGGWVSWGSTQLKYLPEGSEWQYSVAIVPGGTLDRLRRLSEALAGRYRWSEATATTFVLAGETPIVADIAMEDQRDGVRPCLSRLVITVDPTMNPKRLATLYSSWRKDRLGPRYRPQTNKSLRLALAAVEGRNQGLSWEEVMRTWNRESAAKVGSRKYGYVNNFRRDALRALRRLLS